MRDVALVGVGIVLGSLASKTCSDEAPGLRPGSSCCWQIVRVSPKLHLFVSPHRVGCAAGKPIPTVLAGRSGISSLAAVESHNDLLERLLQLTYVRDTDLELAEECGHGRQCHALRLIEGRCNARHSPDGVTE